MKKGIFLLSLFPLFHASAALASGIPVVDAAAIAQSVQNFTQLTLQYETLLKQYEEQIRSYQAITGSRGLGTVLWSETLKDLAPSDLQSTLSRVLSQGPGGLSSGAKALFEKHGMAAFCSALSLSEKTACLKKAAAGAETLSYLAEAETKARERSSRIEKLLSRISLTEDSKAIAELTARISTENAALAAEKIRLDAFKSITEENARLLEKEAQAAAKARWAVPSDWKKHLD